MVNWTSLTNTLTHFLKRRTVLSQTWTRNIIVKTCAPFHVTRLLKNFACVRKAAVAREVRCDGCIQLGHSGGPSRWIFLCVDSQLRTNESFRSKDGTNGKKVLMFILLYIYLMIVIILRRHWTFSPVFFICFWAID